MFQSSSSFNHDPIASKWEESDKTTTSQSIGSRFRHSRGYFWFPIPITSWQQKVSDETPRYTINIINLIRHIDARKEAIIGFQEGTHNHVTRLIKNSSLSLEPMNQFLTLKRVELLIQVPENYHNIWRQIIRWRNDRDTAPVTNLEVLWYIANNGFGPYLLECMLQHATKILTNKRGQKNATEVSVNAFVWDLLEEKTISYFRGLASKLGKTTQRLHIEILEDVSEFILQDREKMTTFVENCKELQHMGYQLSIDDLIPSSLSSSVNVSAKIQDILQQVNPWSMAIKFQWEFIRKSILDAENISQEDTSYLEKMLDQSIEGTFEQTRNVQEIAKLYTIFWKKFADKITFQSYHLKRFL